MMNAWLKPIVLLLALAMVASSTSVPQGSVETAPRMLVTADEEYVAYPKQTAVYYESEGEWYEGVITHYLNGVYTVRWTETGEVEYFDVPSEVDKMVRAAKVNANPDLYDIGTLVIDGENEGEIVDYLNGQYRVEWWTTGAVQAYAPGAAFDALVVNVEEETTEAPTDKDVATDAPTEEVTATDAPTDEVTATDAPTDEVTATEAPTEEDDVYPLGTKVYKKFEVDGKYKWYWGVISWYDGGVYEIKWGDNMYEKYDSKEEMDKMVQDAKMGHKGDKYEDDPWDNGTAVYLSDEALFGEIIGYVHGYYTVQWENDDLTEYNVDETNTMVEDAYEKVQADKALAKKEAARQGGMVFVYVGIVVGVLVAAAIIYRRRRTGIEKATTSKVVLSPLEEEESSTYHDKPEEDVVVPQLPDVI